MILACAAAGGELFRPVTHRTGTGYFGGACGTQPTSSVQLVLGYVRSLRINVHTVSYRSTEPSAVSTSQESGSRP